MAKEYIHFTNEQKEQANRVDLEDFLRSKGESLERSGRDKRLKSDHSITVRGNTWYDHSTEKGGYSIDFVKMFYGLDFPQAVNELLGGTNSAYRSYEKPIEPPKIFALPPKNTSNNKVFAYMTQHRCIESSVLNFFIKKGLIYESREIFQSSHEIFNGREYNNAIFVGLDNDGTPKHAHKRSIFSTGKRFVQNIEGSSPKDSFHYLGGSNRLYIFEAPIDMLSFISMYSHTNWQSHNYVALCGTSSQPMIELIDKHSNIDHVVMCLDNDTAGHKTCDRFAELLDEKETKHSKIMPQNKDFNEDLIAMKNQSQVVNSLVMG